MGQITLDFIIGDDNAITSINNITNALSDLEGSLNNIIDQTSTVDENLNQLGEGANNAASGMGEVSSNSEEAGSAISKLNEGVKGAYEGITGFASAITGTFTELVGELNQLGVEAYRADEGLNTLSGGKTEEYITAMSNATSGMVGNLELTQAAMKGISTGIADTPEKMAEIAKDGQILGDTFMGSAQQGISAFERSLETVGNSRSLKTLGLDAAEVTTKFKELQKEGESKAQAWSDAVLSVADAMSNKLAPAIDNGPGAQVDRLSARWDAFKEKVGLVVATTFNNAIDTVDMMTTNGTAFGEAVVMTIQNAASDIGTKIKDAFNKEAPDPSNQKSDMSRFAAPGTDASIATNYIAPNQTNEEQRKAILDASYREQQLGIITQDEFNRRSGEGLDILSDTSAKLSDINDKLKANADAQKNLNDATVYGIPGSGGGYGGEIGAMQFPASNSSSNASAYDQALTDLTNQAVRAGFNTALPGTNYDMVGQNTTASSLTDTQVAAAAASVAIDEQTAASKALTASMLNSASSIEQSPMLSAMTKGFGNLNPYQSTGVQGDTYGMNNMGANGSQTGFSPAAALQAFKDMGGSTMLLQAGEQIIPGVQSAFSDITNNFKIAAYDWNEAIKAAGIATKNNTTLMEAFATKTPNQIQSTLGSDMDAGMAAARANLSVRDKGDPAKLAQDEAAFDRAAAEAKQQYALATGTATDKSIAFDGSLAQLNASLKLGTITVDQYKTGMYNLMTMTQDTKTTAEGFYNFMAGVDKSKLEENDPKGKGHADLAMHHQGMDRPEYADQTYGRPDDLANPNPLLKADPNDPIGLAEQRHQQSIKDTQAAYDKLSIDQAAVYQSIQMNTVTTAAVTVGAGLVEQLSGSQTQLAMARIAGDQGIGTIIPASSNAVSALDGIKKKVQEFSNGSLNIHVDFTGGGTGAVIGSPDPGNVNGGGYRSPGSTQ